MQLGPTLAQPAGAPSGPSPFLSVLTTLRGERPPASQAAPLERQVAAPPIQGPPEEPQASLGATLLGNVATSQNRYLANQQVLGELSAALGARFSHVAKSVWSMLRGEEAQPAAAQQAPTEA